MVVDDRYKDENSRILVLYILQLKWGNRLGGKYNKKFLTELSRWYCESTTIEMTNLLWGSKI